MPSGRWYGELQAAGRVRGRNGSKRAPDGSADSTGYEQSTNQDRICANYSTSWPAKQLDIPAYLLYNKHASPQEPRLTGESAARRAEVAELADALG